MKFVSRYVLAYLQYSTGPLLTVCLSQASQGPYELYKLIFFLFWFFLLALRRRRGLNPNPLALYVRTSAYVYTATVNTGDFFGISGPLGCARFFSIAVLKIVARQKNPRLCTRSIIDDDTIERDQNSKTKQKFDYRMLYRSTVLKTIIKFLDFRVPVRTHGCVRTLRDNGSKVWSIACSS